MTFKTLRRRGASLFLALTMCVSLLQVPAYAVDGAENDTPDVNVTVVPVNNTDAANDAANTPAPEVPFSESTDTETAAPEDNGEFDLSKTERPEQTDDITVAPGSPEDIGTSENPDEPEVPVEPETPVEPENPSESETPVEPENPSEPVTPVEPENPGEVEEPGNTEDKGNSGANTQDKNWDIFYNAEKGIYELTFNIDEDAEELHQVVDLTQALELLGQYAQVGKQEMEQAKAELEKQKPVKPSIDPPAEPELPDAPVEPEKPVAPDAPAKPVEPTKPLEPGKPEGLDKNLDTAYQDILANVPRDKYGEPDQYFDYKSVIAEKTGLSKDDPFVVESAKHMYDQAMVDWCVSSWEKWESEGHIYAQHFGDMDTFLYYGCGITVKWPEGFNTGTPILKQDAPEYTVDKNSQAYKDYKDALNAYNLEIADYNAKLEQYEADQAAYEEKYGTDSPEYKAYLEKMEQYEAQLKEYTFAKALAEAQYAMDMAQYIIDVGNIEAKYAKDMDAYNAAVKELNDKYENWSEADVLQPGDVLKFVIYLTSDSKHTYKYQEGSFTLATPGWGEQPGEVEGFDGQILPDEYVDNHKYHVTLTAKPMQDLFKNIGMLDPENPLNNNGIGAMFDGKGNINSYPSYWNSEINKFLNHYEGETTADKLNAYILDYYNSADGTEYTTIDALLKANPDARKELTKTITDGNKWFSINGIDKFVVDAHLETVLYDTFYQNLLSFAYGDDVTIADILGDFEIVNGRFEYDNDSWTSNGLKNALAYYMAHEEIWETTDNYFQQLLKNGLSAKEATWTSFMMALNIDGEMTGNDWQDTKWPWYNSIQLERMDIDFNLKKTDSETNETITSSETEFSVYYIDTVKNDDGTETKVNMYCTYDEATGSYTFVPTVSTVWTKNGELNIDYAMMKDIVYYLQEMTAPEGYDRDTNVYIVMDEETYNNMTDEDKSQLGEFDKFLDMTTSEDGLTVNVQFVNSKTPTPPPEEPDDPTPPPTTPDRPDRPTTPPTTDIPDPDVPLAPGPDPEEPPVIIEEPDVPLAELPPEVEIPEPEVPLAGQPPVTTTIPEPEVPLADVPMTGDASGLWYALMGLAACGLVVLNLRKKEEA